MQIWRCSGAASGRAGGRAARGMGREDGPVLGQEVLREPRAEGHAVGPADVRRLEIKWRRSSLFSCCVLVLHGRVVHQYRRNICLTGLEAEMLLCGTTLRRVY